MLDQSCCSKGISLEKMGYGVANKFIKEVLHTIIGFDYSFSAYMYTAKFLQHGCCPFPMECFHKSLDFTGSFNKKCFAITLTCMHAGGKTKGKVYHLP